MGLLEQLIAEEFNAGLRVRCSVCEDAFPKGQYGSHGSYCRFCNLQLTRRAELMAKENVITAKNVEIARLNERWEQLKEWKSRAKHE